MREGFYSVHYTGVTGLSGIGMLLLRGGKIVGVDVGGGKWLGRYSVIETGLEVSLALTFPTAANLVTGESVAAGAVQTESNLLLPDDLGGGAVVRIELGVGPMNAVFHFLTDPECVA